MRQSPVTDDTVSRSDGRLLVTKTTVTETDRYSDSVAGLDLDVVRAKQGLGPNRVMSAVSSTFMASSVDIGFPILTRTTVSNEHIILARINSVGPGSRWCHVDLEPGALFVYSPGAEHTAVNTPGTNFTFTMVSTEQLEFVHEMLGISLTTPPRGEVRQMAVTPVVAERVRVAFDDLTTSSEQNGFVPVTASSEVLGAFAAVLRSNKYEHRIGFRKRIDNRKVIRQCLEYAAIVDRIPSTIELCSVAHVSERRLREAFTCEYNMPPTQYFRLWALDLARCRLLREDPSAGTVTNIAARLGFLHLGRFAGYYRSVYGERPSTTLQGGTGQPRIP